MALVEAISARIKRHIVATREQILVVVLWVVLTWVHDTAATHSPILMVTSAQADSGKTTLLGLVAFLARMVLPSVEISPAALYRSIEKWHPAFVIDEADDIFARNEELRAVFNSGWTRGQGVVRCDPDTNEPRLYSTFCPKAIGLKGRNLPDTTLTRTIPIEMKPKLDHEEVADFGNLDDSELAEFRSRLARWARDNVGGLHSATPEMPLGFRNRTASNWRLMFAIADRIGLGREARSAAASITGGAIRTLPRGAQLLEDIRKAFDEAKADSLPTNTIIGHLIIDQERPWAAYGRDRKPITPHAMGRVLREYKIFSQTLYPPEHSKGIQGYRRDAFNDAWLRYLPDSKVRTSGSTTETGVSDENQRSGNGHHPDLSKMQETAVAVGNPDIRTFETGEWPGEEEREAENLHSGALGPDDDDLASFIDEDGPGLLG
jgi:hypothetical protein